MTQSVTPMDIVSFSQCRETASMPRQKRPQYKQDLRGGVYGCSARNNATAIPVNTTGLAHKGLGNPPRGYGLITPCCGYVVCTTIHPCVHSPRAIHWRSEPYSVSIFYQEIWKRYCTYQGTLTRHFIGMKTFYLNRNGSVELSL